jgi:ankyrin repeat protein
LYLLYSSALQFLKAKPKPLDADDVSKVLRAAASGDLEEVRRLVRKDKRLAQATRPGVDEETSVLSLASRAGHLEVVRYLLDEGADLHHEGDQAFRRACRRGRADVVALLLQRGADREPSMLGGDTPLTHAVARDDGAMVEALLAHGPRHVNEDNYFDETPLITACRLGHAAIAERLLAAGADPMLRGFLSGATPLDIAKAHGSDECVALLQVRCTAFNRCVTGVLA